MPSLGPELQPLLLSFQNYLTLRPTHENGVLQITAARAKALEPRVRAAIAALDSDGRWIAKFRGHEQIRTDTFIANARAISDYIEAVK